MILCYLVETSGRLRFPCSGWCAHTPVCLTCGLSAILPGAQSSQTVPKLRRTQASASSEQQATHLVPAKCSEPGCTDPGRAAPVVPARWWWWRCLRIPRASVATAHLRRAWRTPRTQSNKPHYPTLSYCRCRGSEAGSQAHTPAPARSPALGRTMRGEGKGRKGALSSLIREE